MKTLTVKQAELKIRTAIEKAIDMGWHLRPGISFRTETTRCCALGALDVASGDIPYIGGLKACKDFLCNDQIDDIITGFDSSTIGVFRHGVNKYFHDLGMRLRQDYVSPSDL